MSGTGHSPRHSQAPMPIAEEGPEELRRRMSQLSNSDIEKVASVALGEVTRRNSNRHAIIEDIYMCDYLELYNKLTSRFAYATLQSSRNLAPIFVTITAKIGHYLRL